MLLKFLGTNVSFPSYYPGPTAWLEHGPFMMWLVRRIKPELFVELGTFSGYSYFAACETVASEELKTKCIAVDTWEGDKHAGFYGIEIYKQVEKENQKYSSFSSLKRCTFDQALYDIQDRTVDLLHIDGRHTYEDVKHDFESWMPKLKPNAIVLFHDTEVRRDDFGVYLFWTELAKVYPTANFLHGYGLGILCFGDRPPEALVEFFDLSERDIPMNFFESTGLICQLKHPISNNPLTRFVKRVKRSIIRLPTKFKKIVSSS